MKLLEHIGKERRKIEGAIFTTYVFDPIFFENCLLKLLHRRGIGPNIVVFLDLSSYLRTLSGDINRTPKYVGKNYTLVPVTVSCGVFHPKIILFTSRNRAQLYIGSMNLTDHGFTTNLEIVSYFELEKGQENYELLRLFADLKLFFEKLINSDFCIGISDVAKRKIGRILSKLDWLIEPNKLKRTNIKFIHNLDSPLWEQIFKEVKINPREIFILGPYYDPNLEVVERILSDFPSSVLNIILQQGKTSIKKDNLMNLTKNYYRVNLLEANNRERYLHAKLISLADENSAVLYWGSANPTFSGLLRSADMGNIEVGLICSFEKDRLKELLEDKIFGGVKFAKIENLELNYEEREIREELGTNSLILRNAEIKNNKLFFKFDLPESLKNIPVEMDLIASRYGREIIKRWKLTELDLKNSYIRLGEDDIDLLSSGGVVVYFEIRAPGYEGKKSSKVWLDVEPEQSEVVHDEEGFPDLFVNYFISSEDVDILSLLETLFPLVVIKKDYPPRRDRGRSLPLPPDYGKTIYRKRSIIKVLWKFLNTYLSSLKRLEDIEEDEKIHINITELASDLRRIFKIYCRLVVLLKFYSNPRKKEELRDCIVLTRGYLRNVVGGNPSLIERLVHYIVENYEQKDTEDYTINELLPLLASFMYVSSKFDNDFYKTVEQNLVCSSNYYSKLIASDPNIVFQNLPKIILNLSGTLEDLVDVTASSDILKDEVDSRDILFEFLSKVLVFEGVDSILSYFKSIEPLLNRIKRKDEINDFNFFSAKISKAIQNYRSNKDKEVLLTAIEKVRRDWYNKGLQQWKLGVLLTFKK